MVDKGATAELHVKTVKCFKSIERVQEEVDRYRAGLTIKGGFHAGQGVRGVDRRLRTVCQRVEIRERHVDSSKTPFDLKMQNPTIWHCFRRRDLFDRVLPSHGHRTVSIAFCHSFRSVCWMFQVSKSWIPGYRSHLRPLLLVTE